MFSYTNTYIYDYVPRLGSTAGRPIRHNPDDTVIEIDTDIFMKCKREAKKYGMTPADFIRHILMVAAKDTLNRLGSGQAE